MSIDAVVLDEPSRKVAGRDRRSRLMGTTESAANASDMNLDANLNGTTPVAAEPNDMTRTASVPEPVVSVARQTFADLIELTKPRIVVMILITTGVAAIVAAGTQLDLAVAVHLLFGTAFVAASAGVMNQYLEREIDRRMTRTARRPLPAGRISPTSALVYGLTLGLLGTAHLAWRVSPEAAILGCLTWVGYLAVYTPLKIRTSWNTTVGAVAGALPMLMGYVGGGGTLSELNGWLLLGVLVAWQYPHFMAIAWLYRQQYGAAGFKMTPVTEPTGRSAGKQAVAGALVLPLCLCGLVVNAPWWPCWMGLLILVSWGLFKSSIAFATEPNDVTARRMLRASLSQLPLSMLVLILVSLLAR